MVFEGFSCKLAVIWFWLRVIKSVANSLFVCLVARPLTGGEMLRFWGMRSMKRILWTITVTTIRILLVILICVLSNVLWFFQLGQFVGDIGWWRFLGVNIRDCVQDQKSKAKSCFYWASSPAVSGTQLHKQYLPNKCSRQKSTPSYFLNEYT